MKLKKKTKLRIASETLRVLEDNRVLEANGAIPCLTIECQSGPDECLTIEANCWGF